MGDHALDLVAPVVAFIAICFSIWGVIDSCLDRRSVIRSGTNGLRKLAANERLIAAWLVLVCQIAHVVEVIAIVRRPHALGGHIALSAVMVVCGVLATKSVLRRYFRTRMRALYLEGHW